MPGSGRAAVAAVVLDDQVYVMGGLGGEAKVLVYDPATDTWAEKASMLKGMVFASASVVDGKIYVMGGAPSMAGSSHALVQEYNPAADTWTEKASLPTPREGLSSAAVDGRIYAIGGSQWDVTTSGGLVVSSVEMYDPATDTWVPKASLPRPRTYAGAAILDGKIYVLGGATRVGQGVSSSMLMYDPGTDTWTEKSPMPGQRALSAAAVHDGRIYVFGGAESFTEPPSASSTVFVYDPAADTWTERGDMPFERRGMAAAVVSGKVYLFGGSKKADPGPPFSREVWEYDPEAAD
jgi:N-acetylneuraminic acid mutarotase